MRRSYLLVDLLFLSGAALLALAPPLPAQEAEVSDLLTSPQPAEAVPGRVIVKLRDVGIERQGALAAAEVAPLGLEVAPEVTSGGELIYRLNIQSLIEIDSAQALEDRVEAIAAELAAREDVVYAQPDWIVQPLLEPNDSLYAEQWHYRTNGTGAGQSPGGIGLPAAWDVTTGDPAVTVAVIDTGLLDDHADIAGSANLRPGYDMISDPARANDGDGRDASPYDAGDAVVAGECGAGRPARPSSWHGSHVAGTVGAGASDNGQGTAGVSWTSGVQAIRVLGKCGGATSDINDAIRWAAGLPVPGVPLNPTPSRIINMSLGAPVPCSASPSTQAAINDAAAAGVTVVVAAGNDAADASGSFPASCDNVIAVAAGDARGHLARYSNFGAVVDIMAPGGDVQRDDDGDGQPDGILSTVSGGYARYNGTSMATPHVAGAVALLLAHRPGLTAAELLTRLSDTALPRDSAECPQPCGAGLMQVVLQDEPPPEPGPQPEGYRYDAKFICGERPALRGEGQVLYDTIVNVINPGREDIRIDKRLALAIPPGGQEPGEVRPVAQDALPAGRALAADCADIAARVFGGALPGGFIDGFLTVTAPRPVRVVAVYRTEGLDGDGWLASADTEVETVPETQRPSAGE